MADDIEIVRFSNTSRADRALLARFVQFHRKHYREDAAYVPLLDYEYTGLKLIGMTGFFEPENLFFRHGRMAFFLARQGGEEVARCCAYTNDRYTEHWGERVGFFGHFESVDDVGIAGATLAAARQWLEEQEMPVMRGPVNFPVNEATPGLLTEGFDSRPVIYYHYSKPYYGRLLQACGFTAVKRVFSWEVPVGTPIEEKLRRVSEIVMKRSNVTLESWGERPLEVRKREMLAIYNEAWGGNYGFVPFTEEEFGKIIDDMMLIMDKRLFVFAYVGGEAAGFFGGVLNVTERMVPRGLLGRFELLRAAWMLLTSKRTRGFRLGYLGVKRKYRHLGLDGIMLYHQKQYAQSRGYEYCDIGWVLEDNEVVIRMAEMMEGVRKSKTYTIFEKPIGSG